MSQAGAATSLTSADVVTSITATAPLTANGVSGTPEVGDVTIAITNPLPLADGGTGSDLGVVDNGVFVTGNTGVTAILANGTAGYVLTANTGAPPSWQSGGGGGITTIDVDGSGHVTGSTVKLYANSGSASAGSSVSFTAVSATEIDFALSDTNDNLFLGQSCGNASAVAMGATSNLFIGFGNAASVTTAEFNVAVGGGFSYGFATGNNNSSCGYGNGGGLVGGNYNGFFGSFLGGNYALNESSNILIGYNVQGTASENNVLRVGVATGTGDGDLAAAYVCGINGVTVTGSPVLVNSSNQLAAGGISTNTSQPAFLVKLQTQVSSVTGDGTTYTIIFDTATVNRGSNFNISTGTFTAPVTGLYLLSVSVQATGISAQTNGYIQIVTTGGTFTGTILNPTAVNAGGDMGFVCTVLAPMTATNTAVFNVTLSGSTKSVNMGGGLAGTYASGYLVC